MITGAMKVRALRQAGYKVYVSHRRRSKAKETGAPVITFSKDGVTAWEAKQKGYVVQPKGGHTVVNIYHDGLLVAAGDALCSRGDLFSRKRGLNLAVSRAIAQSADLRAVVAALVQSQKSIH